MANSVLISGKAAPLIGITGACGGSSPGDVSLVTLQRPYVEAIRDAGGSVVVIPPFIDQSMFLAGKGGTQISSVGLERILSALDGIVFAGGEDVCPSEYGQEPHPKLGSVCKERDFTELYLARAAHQRGIPTLAICRGCQLINVALGGTLIQDLPEQRGVNHRFGSHDDYSSLEIARHSLKLVPNSRLASILEVEEIGVNSSHHQAVERLGERLKVVAVSEDGTVEAIEDSSQKFFIGVQGHPERMCGRTEPRWQRLFRAFVSSCM